MAMAVAAGDLVGVAEGREVQQSQLACPLPGGEGFLAVGATEHHDGAPAGKTIDIRLGLFRACSRIEADQL